MNINLIFDNSALAAPVGFTTAVQTAANILDYELTDNITVNIEVGYGDFQGTPLSNQNEDFGGATSATSVQYPSVRNLLISRASPGDPIFGTLPAGSAIQGQSQVWVYRAEEKALGLLSATDPGLDGAVGFGTNTYSGYWVGAALHELTHALGRVNSGPQPGIFDLFRFVSPGTRLFSDQLPSPQAYFSIDGGITDLADYGINSDPSDFLNSSGRSPADPFNEFADYGMLQQLTATDLKQLDALGFHVRAESHGVAGDFNGDHTSDVAWFNSTSGDVDEWQIANGKWAASVDIGSHPGSGWQIAGIQDFNGDGISDVLWFNPGSGQTDIWELSNGKWLASVSPGTHPAGYQVAGVADFTGTGTSDILWYNAASKDAEEWLISNGHWAQSLDLGAHPGSGWQIGGVGDFNGDGTSDVFWYNQGSGQSDIWELLNGHWSSSISPGIHPTGYTVAGIGDFKGGGTSDVLFFNSTTGDVDEWLINDGKWAGSVDLGSHPGSGWQISGVGDYNGDGTSDVLWSNPNTGGSDIWLLANGKWAASVSPGNHPTGYQVAFPNS
jgi:hypothetical protein